MKKTTIVIFLLWVTVATAGGIYPPWWAIVSGVDVDDTSLISYWPMNLTNSPANGFTPDIVNTNHLDMNIGELSQVTFKPSTNSMSAHMECLAGDTLETSSLVDLTNRVVGTWFGACRKDSDGGIQSPFFGIGDNSTTYMSIDCDLRAGADRWLLILKVDGVNQWFLRTALDSTDKTIDIWVFWALVQKGGGTTNDLTFYINGVIEPITTFTVTNDLTAWNSNAFNATTAADIIYAGSAYYSSFNGGGIDDYGYSTNISEDYIDFIIQSNFVGKGGMPWQTNNWEEQINTGCVYALNCEMDSGPIFQGSQNRNRDSIGCVNGAGAAVMTRGSDGANGYAIVSTGDYGDATVLRTPLSFAFWADTNTWKHYSSLGGTQYVNGVEQAFTNYFYTVNGTVITNGIGTDGTIDHNWDEFYAWDYNIDPSDVWAITNGGNF